MTTPNLSLPYIDVNAAQREVVHNEALRALDALVQLSVLDRNLAAPPGSPTNGQRWIVAASPTGDWAGHANHVAAWQDGAWQFFVPRTGWFAFVIDEGLLVAWNGSAWEDALASLTVLQNLALLGVGTAADATNPLSAKLNNALFLAKTVVEGGDGHLRYKLSKETASKTLSLLMQTGLSGRAEIGLTGDDDLHIKVSADGTTWHEGLSVVRSSGQVRLGIDGTEAAPALAFGSDTDNGAYRIGANNWGLSAGGTKVIDLSATAVGIATGVLNFGASTINFNYVDTGATGPSLISLHDSASPAANDSVYRAIHDGRDTVGADTVYGMYEVIISSPTNGSEAGFISWRTVQAGTLAPRMALKAGLVLGSPTGDDKGHGTLNAGAVYDDNTLLTCFGVEFLVDGVIDVAKWDRYSPSGRNPIVHRFAEMVNEFDPRDPISYVSKMKVDRALPGMPTEREWEHNKFSIGSMHNHLWLSTELLASAFAGHIAWTQVLERRVAALEAKMLANTSV